MEVLLDGSQASDVEPPIPEDTDLEIAQVPHCSAVRECIGGEGEGVPQHCLQAWGLLQNSY